MCPTQYASCTLGTLCGWHRRPGPETQVKGHGQAWEACLGRYREDSKPLLGFLAERPGELVLDHIVERKRLDDLCSSIIDGRFREQKVPQSACLTPCLSQPRKAPGWPQSRASSHTHFERLLSHPGAQLENMDIFEGWRNLKRS